MITSIRDLVRHKWSANASLLASIRQCERAASDDDIRKLLHHILVANRYWLLLTLGKQFDPEVEMSVPGTLDRLAELYRQTEAEEMKWLMACDESDLNRLLETPFLPGQEITVAQAKLQICLHSHGHRAQCATRLREMGGTPPPMDFILWLKERPEPRWPELEN
jgi:uncharacterized damage-inducible protein DinB